MTKAQRPSSVTQAGGWPDHWLAEAAERRGIVTAGRLNDLGEHATAWEALLAAGASEQAVLELACLVSATKPADLSTMGPADAALMAKDVAERHGVVAVRKHGVTLVVAASNPLGPVERDLSNATGRRVEIVTASPQDIISTQQRIYGARSDAVAKPTHGSTPSVGPGATRVATPPAQRKSVVTTSPDAPDDPDASKSVIASLLDQVLTDALLEEASDLHFEPKEDGLLVRFRVDGALHDARRIAQDQSPQIVRRLKVLAGMDITDTLRPQDGRASITHEGRNIDLRVSTLPLGGYSEKVVVRVLDSLVAARELDMVGFRSEELNKFRRLLDLPEGLILVTGPTGSGKTSTLYAAVRYLHRSDINIVTVEDPIEYRIAGINQVQVNERARMTFSASLRAILRQDPDVVLIGEMRDAETSLIAVKASMTGHLVLSTVHAADALSTLDRLYGMEIDTAALGAALKGIIGQRLVRRLCPQCSISVVLSNLPAHQQQLLVGRDTSQLRQPVGCVSCRGTGYRGRTIVAEIFIVTPSIQRSIARRVDGSELADLAVQSGAVTMWESGLQRVLDGTTSLYELLDNVAAPLIDLQNDSSQADIDALLAQLLTTPAPRTPLPEFQDIEPPVDGGDVATEAPAPPPHRRDRATSPAMPVTETSLRVLVVDDDRPKRRALVEALECEGMVVIEAADGEAALNYARRLRPDVVVTEIALPGLDAIGLVQALSTGGHVPRVIVYTRQTDGELRSWLLELGAEDVVAHSADARVLVQRLRRTEVSAT